MRTGFSQCDTLEQMSESPFREFSDYKYLVRVHLDIAKRRDLRSSQYSHVWCRPEDERIHLRRRSSLNVTNKDAVSLMNTEICRALRRKKTKSIRRLWTDALATNDISEVYRVRYYCGEPEHMSKNSHIAAVDENMDIRKSQRNSLWKLDNLAHLIETEVSCRFRQTIGSKRSDALTIRRVDQ